MKTYKLLFAIGSVAAMTLVAGCDSKTTEPAKQPDQPAAPPAQTPAPSAPASASAAVEAVKPAVEQAVTETKAVAATATTAATTAAAEVTSKFNTVVEQAKKYLGETKYTEALNSLQQLSGLKLTPEQEKIVSDLKAQIQKLMAAKATTDGASAVGNLLKK